MNNIHQIKVTPEAALLAVERMRASADNQGQMPPGGGNGEPPMEARVSKLESIAEKTVDRLISIEKDLAVMSGELSGFKSEAMRSFATKSDLAEVKNSIIMWVVSAFLLAQLLPSLMKRFGL